MDRDGVIYTETIVHAAPEQYAADAPYQLAIIELDGGGRITARMLDRARSANGLGSPKSAVAWLTTGSKAKGPHVSTSYGLRAGLFGPRIRAWTKRS